MVMPYPMDLLEQVRPRIASMEENPELAENFELARQRRTMSMQQRTAATEGKWELSYTRGFRPDGQEAPNHRTNLKLADFEES